MIFHFFKTVDSKNRHYAGLVSQLIGVKLKGKLPDGTDTEVEITSPEDVVNYFGSTTTLFDVTTIDYLQGRHEISIEERLMVHKDGKMVRQGERYNAVLMDIAITSWSLPDEKSESGFLNLPSVVGTAILSAVTNHLFGFDFPSDTKN